MSVLEFLPVLWFNVNHSVPLHFTLLSIINVLQSAQNVKDFSNVLINYCPFATQELGFLLNLPNLREQIILLLLVVLIVSLVTTIITSITTTIVDRNDEKRVHAL